MSSLNPSGEWFGGRAKELGHRRFGHMSCETSVLQYDGRSVRPLQRNGPFDPRPALIEELFCGHERHRLGCVGIRSSAFVPDT